MAEILIITTVYNRLPLVRQCVETVLENTKGKYLFGECTERLKSIDMPKRGQGENSI